MQKTPISEQIPLQMEAKRLLRRGFSVIPVHGDNSPENPKRPAIRWKPFQKRFPSSGEIDSWFQSGESAIGIVCGSISQLMVIDFDDFAGYRRFCRRFPEFESTYTVKTKRGFHLYFETGVRVRSQGFEGGDVKGEGSFVIAPPSRIGETTYRAIRDDEPCRIEDEEVDRIGNHLVVGRRKHLRFPGEVAVSDWLALYQRLANEIGRNNALYRCASIGRESGLQEAEILEMLGKGHVLEPARLSKRQESPGQRWVEAARTIRSAYRGGRLRVRTGGLPNSVREFLLREQRSTIMARLLDGLEQAKLKLGSWLCGSEIVRAVKSVGLGRKSILAALGGRWSMVAGRSIIKSRYVVYLDKGTLKSRKRGRPVEKLYQVPSNAELVRRLGVAWSPSDRLSADDLKSAHAYRLALHREYIKRRSPVVAQSWLARRLGVSDRTVRRFNQELDVQTVERVGSFVLTRSRVKLLPKRRRGERRSATPGYWLETADGRRWPAWRHIGSKLLAERRDGVKVCMRRPSEVSFERRKLPPVYHAMSATAFVQLEWLRRYGDQKDKAGFALKGFLAAMKERAQIWRYQSFPLFFESVGSHIAKDRVAETIGSYLFANDKDGRLVRRPALRGVAYRMLKEFGEGNVHLALAEGWRDLRLALSRQALGDVGDEKAMQVFAREWSGL